MIRTRASALGFATAFVGTTITSGLVATPIANAAPLDAVRSAVVGARTGAACGALNYNIDLEGEAQALIGNTGSTSKPGNYKSNFITRRGIGDPQDEAIDDLIAKSLNAIKNCSYVDFGVGFYRPNLEDGPDYVSIALGQLPEAPPPPVEVKEPPKPAKVPCPAGSSVPEVDAGQTCPPIVVPDVTDAIRADFSTGLGSVSVNVSNSSALSAKCTYDATPFDVHRDFNIGPKGSTKLKFNGFNTLTEYQVSIVCNDASGKQAAPIGTVNQSVTF